MPPPPLLLLALWVAVLGACHGTVDAPEPEHANDPKQDAGTSANRDAGASDGGASTPVRDDAGPGAAALWRPTPGMSWQWQLSGNLDSSFDVSLYDIDLYGSSNAQIAALHAQGRKVICYFDTAYEPYRPDEAALRPYRGKTIDGWPDQNWLDVRQPAVVEVMKKRLDLAQQKKCDGVEGDDVDVANNDTGFAISQQEQRSFIRTLAREAHARGMAYGLKNALEDVEALVDEVDFALNEQCFEYDECELLLPFVRAGKAVFNVEYPKGKQSLQQRAQDFCAKANALGFDSLAKNLDLGPPRYACR